MIRETFKGEEGIVRLDDDVGFLVVRKYGVGLDELLWKAVIEPLENIGPEAGARSACDGVHKHEPLRSIRRLICGYVRK